MVNSLVDAGKALCIAPSATIKVNRFKGNPEKCKALYQLGYDDMQAREKEILAFFERDRNLRG